jgi:hypothetical protein
MLFTWHRYDFKIDVSRVAYSGPYRIEEDAGKYYSHVAVEVSMDPSWIGTDQVRHAVFGEKNGTTQLSLFPLVVSRYFAVVTSHV